MSKAKKVLIILVIFVLVIIVSFAFLLCDFTNNTPDYVLSMDKSLTASDILMQKAEDAAKEMDLSGQYKYLFNEEEINKLLATLVRDIDVSFLKIKAIYLTINDEDKIFAEAPYWITFYRSCLKASGYLQYDNEKVELKLSDAKSGNIELQSWSLRAALSDKNLKKITNSIRKNKVYLTIKREKNYIIATMTKEEILRTIIENSKRVVTGVLTTAIVGGLMNNTSTEIVVNKNGLTGIILHINPLT